MNLAYGRFWHIATFPFTAKIDRYRGKADIHVLGETDRLDGRLSSSSDPTYSPSLRSGEALRARSDLYPTRIHFRSEATNL